LESGTITALGVRGPDAESRLSKNQYTLFVPPSAYWFITEPGPAYLPRIERIGVGIEVSSDTTIDFSADGNLATGRVLLGSTPLGHAEIEAVGSFKDLRMSARDKSKADGSYRMYLPNGEYTFWVKPGPASRFIAPRFRDYEVTAPRTINLNLSGGEWEGTVRDSVTGAPVPSIQVMADGRSAGSAVSETDGKGRFKLVLDPGRTYALSLSKNHGNTQLNRIPGVFAGRDSTFDILIRTPPP
jgi:hypothetical protein